MARSGQGYLAYSHRRSLVDRDLQLLAGRFHGRVLDVGGKKEKKRGLFQPPRVDRWDYLNVDPSTNPDIHASAEEMPVEAEAYDIVLCSEVLEHVESPRRVLAEAHRVLKPHGLLVLTMPFLPYIHGDPDDYQRYTPAKLSSVLTSLGFEVEEIRKEGYYFGTLADLVQRGLAHLRPWSVRALAGVLATPLLVWLKWVDRQRFVQRSPFWGNVTTGFLVVAVKK